MTCRLRSSRSYWILIFTGYLVNLAAIPMLAFVDYWQLALMLALIERFGKGIRTPARDIVLLEVTESIGRGRGLGLHELIDQIGAVIGPLTVAWILYKSYSNYKSAFLILAVPAIIAIMFLTSSIITYPKIKIVEYSKVAREKRLSNQFYMYLIFIILTSLGFMHWFLIAYYLKYSSVVPDMIIPILYMIAMISDAITAYPVGYLHDKFGLKVLTILPITIPILALLVMYSINVLMLIIASMIWGIIICIYEVNTKVAITNLVSNQDLTYAYSVYSVVQGLSWSLGNVIISYLYMTFKNMMITYILVIEMAALLIFIKLLSFKR